MFTAGAFVSNFLVSHEAIGNQNTCWNLLNDETGLEENNGQYWSVWPLHSTQMRNEFLNVPCIQTYNWKEKLADLMVARIKRSTKDQNFNLEARWDLRKCFGAHYKGEYVIYSLEYFQNQFPEL